MEQKLMEFLGRLHPYDQISKRSLDALIADAKMIDFASDTSIYDIGDEAIGLYIVHSGKVEISDALGDLISVLGAGNSFGERGMLNAKAHNVTSARAVENSTLILIPVARFHQLRKDEPAFANFFDRQSRLKRRAITMQDSSVSPLSQLMSSPVISVPSDFAVDEAAKLMKEKRISCLAVVDEAEVLGIFTLRDLTYQVLASAQKPKTVREIMSSPAISLPSTALVIDAMVEMARRQIGHLLVVDDSKLAGIVTKSNLVMRSANSIMGVLLEISRATSAQEMKAPVARLPELLAQLAGAGVDGHIVTRMLTDIADAVTKRLIELYEADAGAAPVPYLWAACGSQGRQEQTGVSDQDNCIIYAEAIEDDRWFKGLAKFVSDGMDVVGYFYCPGNMMATNPKWCQPLSIWRGYFEEWVRKPTEEAQMLASVMFDLRGIEGDQTLLEDLQKDVLKAASENSIFLAFLISNSLKHTPPLSMFRGFVTIRDGEHKNTVDLKHSGVVPITDLARVYAIQCKLGMVNTRTRLQEAIYQGGLSEAGGADLIAAFDFIQEMRLRHQSRQIRIGEKPDNYLDPGTLSDLERSHLRDAFVVVKSMQSALSRQAAP